MLRYAAAVEKSITLADEGAYVIPQNANVQAKDLCRLFLRPRMIVPPPMLVHMLVPASQGGGGGGASGPSRGASATSSLLSGSLGNEEDLIWGQVKVQSRYNTQQVAR